MTDATTKQPIRVRIEDPTLPSVVVPETQLERVTELLTSNGVRFWVGHQRMSFNGQPYVAFINIREGTDPALVQNILDRVD